MTDYAQIYQTQAEEYDLLVSAEDCDNNLIAALQRLVPLTGARALDVGVGTGRVTRLLLTAGAAHVIGVDNSSAMLSVARRRLAQEPASRVVLLEAEAAHLPLAAQTVDVAIAGWTFGHATEWVPQSWRDRILGYVGELSRVTRNGGVEILLETLGTGALVPNPPNEALAAYYRLLEEGLGFQRTVVATDYQFASPEAASKTCEFFFGEQLAAQILRNRWARVPEWTGVWSRTSDNLR